MPAESSENSRDSPFLLLMETRKLEHLIELASTGSFSRAAKNLHITPSALSKSIQSLEDELETKLVERQGRRCTLTAGGELVIKSARRLLGELDDLHKLARQEVGPEGLLRIGFGAGPGAAFTPQFIYHVLSTYLRMRLLIRRGTAKSLVRELRERSIDVLMIDMRSLQDDEGLIVEPIGSLQGRVICRTGYPLTLQPSVSFGEVCSYPILTTATSNEIVRVGRKNHGIQTDLRQITTVECEELEPLLAACVRTDAISLGVAAAAKERIDAGELQVLSITPSGGIHIPIALVRVARHGESNLVQIVRDVAADWFSQISS